MTGVTHLQANEHRGWGNSEAGRGKEGPALELQRESARPELAADFPPPGLRHQYLCFKAPQFLVRGYSSPSNLMLSATRDPMMQSHAS